MRSASLLVVTLRGIATEVCKNIVLAGIGKLTVLDDQDIKEEDLGSGFFFREEEVGQKVCPRRSTRNPPRQAHMGLSACPRSKRTYQRVESAC